MFLKRFYGKKLRRKTSKIFKVLFKYIRPILKSTRTKNTKKMTIIYSEYFAILLFILVSVILSTIVFGLSYIITNRDNNPEKLSAYECGFNPFDDARNKFDVRFYIVAILFIVFDLEVTFLCP